MTAKMKFFISGLAIVLLVIACISIGFLLNFKLKNNTPTDSAPGNVLESKKDSLETVDFKKNITTLIEEIEMFGKTRMEIIKKLGIPLTSNTNQPFIDLNYEGLYLQIYHNGPTEQVKFMSLSSNRYPVKMGLNIGVSKKYLVSILGEPTELINDEYIYSNETEKGVNYLSFYFKDDNIERIEWNVALN